MCVGPGCSCTRARTSSRNGHLSSGLSPSRPPRRGVGTGRTRAAQTPSRLLTGTAPPSEAHSSRRESVVRSDAHRVRRQHVDAFLGAVVSSQDCLEDRPDDHVRGGGVERAEAFLKHDPNPVNPVHVVSEVVINVHDRGRGSAESAGVLRERPPHHRDHEVVAIRCCEPAVIWATSPSVSSVPNSRIARSGTSPSLSPSR